VHARKARGPPQGIRRLQGLVPLLHGLDCLLVFGRFCGYCRDGALGAKDPRMLEKAFGRDAKRGVLLETFHEKFTQKLQGSAHVFQGSRD
jgi:hypothetical protein